MNDSPRFLFDECMGKPSMFSLLDRIDEKPTFAHLCDFFKAGTADEGGWVVISADRAAKSGRGPRLPQLCAEFKITHILLGASVHKQKAVDKVDILHGLWTEIVESCQTAAPGTRMLLKLKSNRSAANPLAARLETVPTA